MNKEDPSQGKMPIWIWIVTSLTVFSIWWLSGMLIDHFVDEASRGTFGDKFGAINALFSGLAFAAIIYTMLMQRAELMLQREELKANRLELKNQSAQLEAQASILNRQSFDVAFFKLLEILEGVKKDLAKLDASDPRYEVSKRAGDDYFVYFFNKLKAICSYHTQTGEAGRESYRKLGTDLSEINIQGVVLGAIMTDASHEYLFTLKPYFSVYSALIRLLMEGTPKSMLQYKEVLKAVQSREEQIVIFYGVRHSVALGDEQIVSFMLEHGLLSDINAGFLFHASHAVEVDKGFFKKTAASDSI
ncbi:hypothetical protein [Zoogloea sp.]|uniref:hypothetical protein n=1 Tax=Zoogloea sp. TaxID=49181 RepID=UPI002604CD67|nr:hypothetical protein [Zoogloea sp.]